MNDSPAEGFRSSRTYAEPKKWAHKAPTQPPDPRAKTAANAHLQRNVMSAPPVMKHPRDREPERPVPPQVGAGAEPGGFAVCVFSYTEALFPEPL